VYGEDGMDGTKIESHYIPTIEMHTMDIEQNYHLRESDRLEHHLIDNAMKEIGSETFERCTKHYKEIIEDKLFLIHNVFKDNKITSIKYPIPYERIIKNAQNHLQTVGIKSMKTDMSPDYILDTIENLCDTLIVKDTEQSTRFFKILTRLCLSPKKILLEYHFTRAIFDWIVSQIQQYYKEALVQPGEMVGIVAAQTIGEMGTQMTLDSFHVSGTEAAVKATSGVPRLKEILSATKKTKTPTLNIYMKHNIAAVMNPVMGEDGIETNDPRVEKAKSVAINIKNSIEITNLSDILESSEIYWDNGKYETAIEKDKGIMQIYKELSELDTFTNKCKSDSPWVLRMKFNKEKMKSYGLRMIDVYTKLNLAYDKYIDCVYSDDNAEECVFRIKLTDVALKDIDAKDELAAVKAMEHNIVYQVLLKGCKGIKKVSLNKKKYDKYNKNTQQFDKVIEWALDTDGTNLMDILANPNVDSTRTVSNDIREIYDTLGIEAARNALYNELINVTSEGSMNYRHLSLLIDTMTYKGILMSIDRHGINRGDTQVLSKCSFEETTDILINASIFSEYDDVNGVSGNVMLGQKPPCGTGVVNIFLDEEHMMELIKDMKPIVLDNIIEEFEEDDNEICVEDDIGFNFKLNEPHKCFQLQEQTVKFT
jgi:DNA-directed RNA polymerase II subunit RPB1